MPESEAVTESSGSSFADWEAAQAAGAPEVTESAEPVEPETPNEEPKEAEKAPEGESEEPHTENQKPVEETPAETPVKDKPKGDFAKLKDKVRARDAENAQLKAELEKLKSGKPPEAEAKPKSDDAKPDQTKYDDLEKYFEDLSDWVYRQRRAEDEKKAEQQRLEDQKRADTEHWNKVSQDALKRRPDFNEVLDEAVDDGLVTPQLAQTVMHISRSNQVAAQEIAYHLATNREEARKIIALPPLQQALELGALRERFKNPPGSGNTLKPQPVVKPTISLSGAGNGVSIGPKHDGNDFARWEREQAKLRRH
jgi:regulator of replication initiation timing